MNLQFDTYLRDDTHLGSWQIQLQQQLQETEYGIEGQAINKGALEGIQIFSRHLL